MNDPDAATNTDIYEIDSTVPLPRVDLSDTLASVLGPRFRDWRALSCLPLGGFTQLLISVDANHQTLVTTLRSSFVWLAAPVCIGLVCINQVASDHQSTSNVWMSNALINIACTLRIMYAHKIYQRRSVLASDFAYLKIIPYAMVQTRMHARPWCVATDPPPSG